MKRIFTISALLTLTVVMLAACSRSSNGGYYENDRDYWMRKESGIVVYADGYCPFYVLETNRGYTIVRTVSGPMPYEGDEVFGDLSRRGVMNLFNYDDNSIIRGEITDYWLSYADAQYIIDNLCYSYNRSENAAPKKAIKQGLKKPSAQ